MEPAFKLHIRTAHITTAITGMRIIFTLYFQCGYTGPPIMDDPCVTLNGFTELT
jgi:hypothetical protein